MTALRARIAHSRRFAWLLWLAFLLPMAQAAGAWHALSHVRLDAAGEQDGKALHHVHCDLCLVAAAVTGGAPGGEPAALHAVPAHHAAPPAPAAAGQPVPPAHAYLSRAPPIARA